MNNLRRSLIGICVLVVATLAYHVGATTAKAQGADQLVGLAWRLADGRAYAVDSNGSIYSGPGFCGPFQLCGQLPNGVVPVCFLDGDVGGSLDIGCTNGNIYTLTGACPSIGTSFCTNVFGSTVSTQPSTWGQMKVKIR